MRKKPYVNAYLRFDEDQHRRVMEAAKRHDTNFNAEVKWLIDQGLEQGERRTHAELIADATIALGDSLATHSLEEEMLSLLEARDYDRARERALLIRKVRKEARDRREELMVRLELAERKARGGTDAR
jgi:hypothetical protein